VDGNHLEDVLEEVFDGLDAAADFQVDVRLEDEEERRIVGDDMAVVSVDSLNSINSLSFRVYSLCHRPLSGPEHHHLDVEEGRSRLPP